LLASRVNKINLSQTINIATKAQNMIAKGINVMDLSVGEPDFITPDHIKNAGIEAINKNITKYTANAGLIELRKEIALKLKIDNNLDYDYTNIVVSNGAKQSIFNAILSIIEDEDEVIIPAPFWVSYPEMVSVAGGKSIIIKTKEENGFKITAEELSGNINSKTKLFILCNPSNPTGSVYTRKELEDLSKIIIENNLFVISDEIYEKLIFDNVDYISIASINQEMKERTVTVNGFSKAFSMTGWRLGYSASSQIICEAINKLQSHSTSNASSISQIAAIEALKSRDKDIRTMLPDYKARRDFVYNEITKIKNVTCPKPLGAFYIFPNFSYYIGKNLNGVKIDSSIELAHYLLDHAKVAVVPGEGFGYENHLRISFATSMDNLVVAMKRISEAIS